MFSFNLKNKEVLDSLRSPAVYKFNMAQNLALLSNDPSTIRNFYQIQMPKYYKDTWLAMEGKDKFMAQYLPGQAFTYFGIIPMIVQGKVNLVASSGFNCKSDNKEIDDILNQIKEDADLQRKFIDGVYWESGIGDVLYRISYDKSLCNHPIIDVIEPQYFEIKYSHGMPRAYIIKKVSETNPGVELHEIHSKNEAGFYCIDYLFYSDGEKVSMEDEALIKKCLADMEMDKMPQNKVLPFTEMMVVYKQNSTNNSKIYKGQRGVPDIQGLASIEDALSESISDLIDAIRKGGIKEYVDEDMIPQDERGNDLRLNHFNKTIIITKGSTTPGTGENKWQVTQGKINWESYIRPIQTLMSTAINKAGLSPTTLGLTGLESINSSQESQDAREKPSMRTRSVCLDAWGKTLKELFNKYLQVQDYINGLSIIDYSDLINITFNEYTNPTLENVTNILTQQVGAGLKSKITAIKELNEGMSEEQAISEYELIQAENQNMGALQPYVEGKEINE